MWKVVARDRGAKTAQRLVELAGNHKDVLANEVARVDIAEFLKRSASKKVALIDVRAPCEFNKGRVLGAYNLPLLDDEDRASIGTMYKRAGRKEAVKLGFQLVSPKIPSMIEQALGILQSANANTFAVYCARGGLRSQLTSSFLHSVFVNQKPTKLMESLEERPESPHRNARSLIHDSPRNSLPDVEEIFICDGGYKAYRNYMLSSFEELNLQPQIHIIGGRTGAGKSRLLRKLRDTYKEQIIDLEALANHRGSAFGRIGEINPQPSSEQFGNLLGSHWRGLDLSRPVYIEDEGPNIGDCQIPPKLYAAMRNAPLVVRLEVPEGLRISNLVKDYCTAIDKASFPGEYMAWETDMKNSCIRLRKRLGDERLTNILQALEDSNYALVAQTLLLYYDRLYEKHIMKNRDLRHFITVQLRESDLSKSDVDAYSLLAQNMLKAIDTVKRTT